MIKVAIYLMLMLIGFFCGTGFQSHHKVYLFCQDPSCLGAIQLHPGDEIMMHVGSSCAQPEQGGEK
jgi:hypothetical protein